MDTGYLTACAGDKRIPCDPFSACWWSTVSLSVEEAHFLHIGLMWNNAFSIRRMGAGLGAGWVSSCSLKGNYMLQISSYYLRRNIFAWCCSANLSWPTDAFGAFRFWAFNPAYSFAVTARVSHGALLSPWYHFTLHAWTTWMMRSLIWWNTFLPGWWDVINVSWSLKLQQFHFMANEADKVR